MIWYRIIDHVLYLRRPIAASKARCCNGVSTAVRSFEPPTVVIIFVSHLVYFYPLSSLFVVCNTVCSVSIDYLYYRVCCLSEKFGFCKTLISLSKSLENTLSLGPPHSRNSKAEKGDLIAIRTSRIR